MRSDRPFGAVKGKRVVIVLAAEIGRGELPCLIVTPMERTGPAGAKADAASKFKPRFSPSSQKVFRAIKILSTKRDLVGKIPQEVH